MVRIRPSAISQALGAVNFARPGVTPSTARSARRRHRVRVCVARRLLPEPTAMWFLLDRELAGGGGAEQALSALEAITPLTQGLRRRPPRGAADGAARA